MKRKALAVAAGLTLVTAGVLAQQKTDTMMHGPAVRVAELKGRGMYAKLTGTAVIVLLSDGTHRVFVQADGLPENQVALANHIHYNAAGNASCNDQNGDKIVGLAAIRSDATGAGLASTSLPADTRYPGGATYINIHAGNEAIACGQVVAAAAP
ncbi:MAG: hypothetical protein M1369_01455 [Deinococcus sp.]|nr:hypothetical protein [Deinococcus sp.]